MTLRKPQSFCAGQIRNPGGGRTYVLAAPLIILSVDVKRRVHWRARDTNIHQPRHSTPSTSTGPSFVIPQAREEVTSLCLQSPQPAHQAPVQIPNHSFPPDRRIPKPRPTSPYVLSDYVYRGPRQAVFFPLPSTRSSYPDILR